ncbi:MAG: hypothetical protein WCW61_03475 [Patescibacteria group bacterium]|jgi:hypothetical protein
MKEKKLTLHKMHESMSFDECLVAISEGVIGLILLLPKICQQAVDILGKGHTPYAILSMLDAMEIYGDELATLYARICKDDNLKLFAIIWAVEVGMHEDALDHPVPEFAKNESIKKLIADFRARKNPEYPFDAARKYIEAKSSVVFPKAPWIKRETSLWEAFQEMLSDAYAFVTDPDTRKLSEFKYAHGGPMTIRSAKKEKFIN